MALACHDLRTPLATVHGFARTLVRMGELEEPTSRYVEMIDAASGQIADLLDELSLAVRIEDDRYDPQLAEVDTLHLAREAAERLGADRVRVEGDGGPVAVDLESAERAIAALARCALRHGGLDEVTVAARDGGLEIRPITPSSAPVVLGQDLRDLGAAVAVRVVGALGGSTELEGETLRVRLPAAA